MAAYMDIITGFFESGKTTFIQEILNSKYIKEYQKILLIVCEEGFTEYEEEELARKNVKIRLLEKESDLEDEFMQQLISRENPEYVLMEYNGTWDISKILRLKLPLGYKIRTLFYLSNAETFRNQLSNMMTFIQPHILNSNVVVFNRFETVDVQLKKELVRDIKGINSRTKVTFLQEFEADKRLKERFISSINPENVTWNVKTNLKATFFFILCICAFYFFKSPNIYSLTQSVVSIFLSILIQAIPFILFGAFISAGIQIFVPTGWVMNQITKERWYSFLVACVAGVFMPICDCGMVPIISGLLKKNTPLPQTITFWLSSSAVSPVVVISMLYAFPEQPHLAILRVIAGIFIGIMTGVILKLIHIKSADIINGKQAVQRIGTDILELKYRGMKGKIEAVFAGAKIEFFRVAEYVIMGAFISAVLQTVIPQTMKGLISSNLMIQFVVMIVAAILMSTCSTSNAFIGRSFSNHFFIVPILSFVVMGPMLDLKNMIMLSEVLKKRFLFLLALLIIVEGAIVFGFLSFFF